jgi:PAS domain-containing protein
MDDDELTIQKSQAVFEFTKRKRWPDILISELVNVALLVFSTTGTVIHCDAATQAVTGYTDDQLLSKNFTDFLHGNHDPTIPYPHSSVSQQETRSRSSKL